MRTAIATALLATVCLTAAQAVAAEFELAEPDGTATILVLPEERECVRLAAEDLASDVERITGRRPRVVARLDEAAANSVILGTIDRKESLDLLQRFGVDPQSLQNKREAYRVRIAEGRAGPIERALVIAGSEPRGTMYGLYVFCEEQLGVDPMWFWSNRPPQKRNRLAWEKVEIDGGDPTFTYRGWFVNDEDLLTEWKDGGGKRDINYPYYHQVVAPEVSAKVFEAMLRLRYNLVIPASFVDIRNPAEARLVEDASRRGLMVSQHHIEPLGVSGFGFMNYWRDKGEEVPFSFVRHRDKYEAIWRDYAARWAKYPEVVWQLGLRGIADRPVWVTDPSVPKTDEARGKLISDAIALEWEIVKSIDPRPNPPATVTLWMEGSDLHQKGLLKFPPGVTVVFADNSPGWELQADFYEVTREQGRPYGIYYHHALWGQGPHFVQGPSPQKTYEIFREAVEKKSSHFAILNVGNVREFVLGLDSTGRLLWNFESYDPDRYLKQWCLARFGRTAEQAERCYRRFFANYTAGAPQGSRNLIDGEILATGKRFYKLIAERAVERPDKPWDDLAKVRATLAKVQRQREAVEASAEEAPSVLARLDGEELAFFEANFVAQQRILLGLLRWVESGLQAGIAMSEKKLAAAHKHLKQGQEALDNIRSAQAIAARKPFQDWYRGDRKMNLAAAESLTETACAALASKVETQK